MASANAIYADPGALLKLYLREPQSRAMALWRAKIKGPLLITHHGRVELINGTGLAAHRGYIDAVAHRAAMAALEDDFSTGRYVLADLLWRSTLNRAGEISREHTPTIGCRSLDALHVASALELGSRRFVTFDLRQQRLARAVGLRLSVPAADSAR